MKDLKSPHHDRLRKFLRIGGPLVFGGGLLLTLVGFGGFFLTIFGGSESRLLIACAFIGLPLMFVGGSMCLVGFLGMVSRYVAAEQAPVAIDTINTMAEGTQQAIQTVTRAAAHGISEGIQQAQSPAPENK